MSTFTSGNTPVRIAQHLPTTPGPHPAILLLHGSGGNVGFWFDRIAPHLTRLNLALYAVHYFDRTGTKRADFATITDGRHFPLWLSTIADALAYIRGQRSVQNGAQRKLQIDPSRIALLGISLGAFLALALAAEQAAEPAAYPGPPVRAIVELSGGLAEPWASRATSAFPPTLILHGAADTIVPVAQAYALDQLLSRLGVQHQTRILPGQDHWFDSAAQLQILMATAQFLGQHL